VVESQKGYCFPIDRFLFTSYKSPFPRRTCSWPKKKEVPVSNRTRTVSLSLPCRSMDQSEARKSRAMVAQNGDVPSLHPCKEVEINSSPFGESLPPPRKPPLDPLQLSILEYGLISPILTHVSIHVRFVSTARFCQTLN